MEWTPDEVWYPIAGYKYGYEISNLRRVRSIRSGKILKIEGAHLARRERREGNVIYKKFHGDRIKLIRYDEEGKASSQMVYINQLIVANNIPTESNTIMIATSLELMF